MRFIGREKELEALRRFKGRRSASFLVIRGRRRIGKSRLIEEFAKEFPRSYLFSGLPPEEKITANIQREEFAAQLRQQQIPHSGQDNWSDLFLSLARHCQKGLTLVALDEITWMGSYDPTFLGKLKTAWDLHFKKNSNLVLIVSGSNSAWIEKNLLSSTGFVGRISYRLTLEELPLNICSKFFAKKTSPYEMLKTLSVTGGVPRYLEEIDPSCAAEKNIERICFDKGGLLFNEFDQIFSTLFSKRAGYYAHILHALAGHPVTATEVAHFLKRDAGGDLIEAINDLQQAGFVERLRSWNLKDPSKGELYRYRISDNYIRFYLKYIEPRKHLTAPTLPPGWHSIMGLQFESLVVNHNAELQRLLDLRPEEVLCAGSYFQTKTKNRHGCQIDLLIQIKFGILYLCEIKFSRKELGTEVIAEVQEKIDRLQRPRGISILPVLIHVNGVTDELLDREVFASVIDFGQLLEQRK